MVYSIRYWLLLENNLSDSFRTSFLNMVKKKTTSYLLYLNNDNDDVYIYDPLKI